MGIDFSKNSSKDFYNFLNEYHTDEKCYIFNDEFIDKIIHKKKLFKCEMSLLYPVRFFLIINAEFIYDNINWKTTNIIFQENFFNFRLEKYRNSKTIFNNYYISEDQLIFLKELIQNKKIYLDKEKIIKYNLNCPGEILPNSIVI
uniref:Uncharacterized protein n=1 Tax=viral metagenome TaxID=1070528 RepID=A0A6C0AFL7_9ZZZZ